MEAFIGNEQWQFFLGLRLSFLIPVWVRWMVTFWATVWAQTLTGGLTNRCWKLVAADGTEYVWRPITWLLRRSSLSSWRVSSALCYWSPRYRIGPIVIMSKAYWLNGLRVRRALRRLRAYDLLVVRWFRCIWLIRHDCCPTASALQRELIITGAYSLMRFIRLKPAPRFIKRARGPSIPSVESVFVSFDLGYNLWRTKMD